MLAPSTLPTWSTAQVRQVQTELKRIGLEPSVDGVLDPSCVAALNEAFGSDSWTFIDVDGVLDRLRAIPVRPAAVGAERHERYRGVTISGDQASLSAQRKNLDAQGDDTRGMAKKLIVAYGADGAYDYVAMARGGMVPANTPDGGKMVAGAQATYDFFASGKDGPLPAQSNDMLKMEEPLAMMSGLMWIESTLGFVPTQDELAVLSHYLTAYCEVKGTAPTSQGGKRSFAGEMVRCLGYDALKSAVMLPQQLGAAKATGGIEHQLEEHHVVDKFVGGNFALVDANTSPVTLRSTRAEFEGAWDAAHGGP
jgi:hypothetical protein